jgi:hypothetical protein
MGKTKKLGDLVNQEISITAPLTGGGPLTGILSIGINKATASADGYLSSEDWSLFNSKQTTLNGTGFVKISGTTISYDNTSYYPTPTGTTTQYIRGNGSLATFPSLSGFVPYAGANQDVNLGLNDMYTSKYWMYDGPNDNYGSMHFTDGNYHVEDADGHKLFVIEDGFLQIHKTDTIQSNLYTSNLTAIRDHYLPNESGVIALTSDLHNPVTLGSANGLSLTGQILSLGVAGTSSTGALSSTDWNTFNNKQATLTNPVTGTGTVNYIPKFTGSTTLGNSQIFDNGTNVGVGVASPVAKLHVEGTTTGSVLFLKSNKPGIGGSIIDCNDSDNNSLFRVFGNVASSNYSVSLGDVSFNGLPLLQVNSSCVFFGDTNVGIGTNNPGVKFVNSGGAFSSGPTLGSGIVGSQALLSNNGLYGLYSGVSSNGDVWYQVQRNDTNTAVYNLALQPSGGNIYIGTTSPVSSTSAKLQFLFNGLIEYGINFRSTSADSNPINFTSSTGTRAGYILQDATGVFLVSVSDYRLKEDLNAFNGLDLVSKINVYDYKWKDQDKRSFGVMAHELQEVVPQAAFGEKDAEIMQGVNYSTLVPILIQAIKELKAEIDILKQN